MKVTVEQSESEATYPTIKRARESGRIVLFTAPRTGMALYPQRNDVSGVGHYLTSWHEEDFEPFHGTITIKC